MTDLSAWLLKAGGIWGVIAFVLGGTVVYLERKARRAEEKRVIALEQQCLELKSELKAEHIQRLLDLRAFAEALTKQADEYIEAMKAVGRWGKR